MPRVMHLVSGQPQLLAETTSLADAMQVASKVEFARERVWIENSVQAHLTRDFRVSVNDLSQPTHKCQTAGDWRVKLLARSLSGEQLHNLVELLRDALRTAEYIRRERDQEWSKTYESERLRLDIKHLPPQEPTPREKRVARKNADAQEALDEFLGGL